MPPAMSNGSGSLTSMGATFINPMTFTWLHSLPPGYDEADLRQRYFEAFGPGSAYNAGADGSASHFKGQAIPEDYPLKRKWLNMQTRRFVECHMENKTVDDIVDEDMGSPDSIPRLIGLVALYAGTDMFLDVVEKAVFIFQTFDMSVAVMMATLRIMEQYILHGNSKEHLVEGGPGVYHHCKHCGRVSAQLLPCRNLPLPRNVQIVNSLSKLSYNCDGLNNWGEPERAPHSRDLHHFFMYVLP